MSSLNLGARVPIRYHLSAYSKDHLWLPAAIWGLFALLVGLDAVGRPDQVGASFIGIVLPLLAGVLACSCVLEDPALELQLAAPRQARRILLERLGMLLAIVTVESLTYQAFLALAGVSMSAYGSLLQRQALWLAPTLAMLGLGSALALGTAQSMTGAMLTGLVWLAQILARSWFINSPWARHLFLFAGFFTPASPYLAATHLCLTGVAGLLMVLAWRALERQERYL
ncbi:MAG: hypothetical protein ACOYEW_07045 [Anaerolineae bacterium]|jgi:hypothetical protein